MNLIEKKQINKLLKNANCVLIATDNGTGVIGREPEVLACFTMLVKNLADDVEKERLQDKFDMAFKTTDELMQILNDKIKEAMEATILKKGK